MKRDIKIVLRYVPRYERELKAVGLPVVEDVITELLDAFVSAVDISHAMDILFSSFHFLMDDDEPIVENSDRDQVIFDAYVDFHVRCYSQLKYLRELPHGNWIDVTTFHTQRLSPDTFIITLRINIDTGSGYPFLDGNVCRDSCYDVSESPGNTEMNNSLGIVEVEKPKLYKPFDPYKHYEKVKMRNFIASSRLEGIEVVANESITGLFCNTDEYVI